MADEGECLVREIQHTDTATDTITLAEEKVTDQASSLEDVPFRQINVQPSEDSKTTEETSNTQKIIKLKRRKKGGEEAAVPKERKKKKKDGVLSKHALSRELQEKRISALSTWLLQNYQEHLDNSIARSIVFAQYEEYCKTNNTELVNPATFGKVIRAVFPDVQTRRLGVRGSSKYHYFGIRPVPTPEELANEAEMIRKAELLTAEAYERRKGKRKNYNAELSGGLIEEKRRRKQKKSKLLEETVSKEKAALEAKLTASKPKPQELPYQPLVPDFDEFARFVHQICQPIPHKIPTNMHPEAMCAFSVMYQNHIHHLLRTIAVRDFAAVEVLLSMFWGNLPRDLWPCLNCEEGLRIVSIADDYLFQVILHILVPEVLEPLPLSVTQSIRHFAKCLEIWMARIFEGPLPIPLVEDKLESCRRFCQALRRRTSLNHLAQAVKAVLSSTDHIKNMLKDLSSIDFGGLREQVSWVIPGYETFLVFMEESFQGMLMEGAGVVSWISWLESVVEQTISQQMGVELQDAGRELMLRWSFFTTMIQRDLTLRSAPSFGSYHLMRLLFDEYIMYYMEKKLDEQRRAIGLMAYWPAQQETFESTMMGFASMDELFRKSGLLAYAAQHREPTH